MREINRALLRSGSNQRQNIENQKNKPNSHPEPIQNHPNEQANPRQGSSEFNNIFK